MQIRISETHEVKDSVASVIAADFLEWLDTEGWVLVPQRIANLPAVAEYIRSNSGADESYQELADRWRAQEEPEMIHRGRVG